MIRVGLLHALRPRAAVTGQIGHTSTWAVAHLVAGVEEAGNNVPLDVGRAGLRRGDGDADETARDRVVADADVLAAALDLHAIVIAGHDDVVFNGRVLMQRAGSLRLVAAAEAVPATDDAVAGDVVTAAGRARIRAAEEDAVGIRALTAGRIAESAAVLDDVIGDRDVGAAIPGGDAGDAERLTTGAIKVVDVVVVDGDGARCLRHRHVVVILDSNARSPRVANLKVLHYDATDSRCADEHAKLPRALPVDDGAGFAQERQRLGDAHLLVVDAGQNAHDITRIGGVDSSLYGCVTT